MASLDNLSPNSNVKELWPLYKTKHNKNYEPAEDKERFEIFKGTVNTVVEHNGKFDKGEVTYQMGLNHFADLRPEERPCGGHRQSGAPSSQK